MRWVKKAECTRMPAFGECIKDGARRWKENDERCLGWCIQPLPRRAGTSRTETTTTTAATTAATPLGRYAPRNLVQLQTRHRAASRRMHQNATTSVQQHHASHGRRQPRGALAPTKSAERRHFGLLHGQTIRLDGLFPTAGLEVDHKAVALQRDIRLARTSLAGQGRGHDVQDAFGQIREGDQNLLRKRRLDAGHEHRDVRIRTCCDLREQRRLGGGSRTCKKRKKVVLNAFAWLGRKRTKEPLP